MRLVVALLAPFALFGCTGNPCGGGEPPTTMPVTPGTYRSGARPPCPPVALPSVESCANLTLTLDDAKREVRVTYDWEGKHYVEVYRVARSRDVSR